MSEPEKPWTWGDQPPQPAKHPIDLHPEGTRFLATGYDADMHVFDKGDWVRYTDYARLKAECQARQAENSVLAVECDSLKAEVERLTKAGDLMCRMAGNNQVINRHWKTAKKGGQK
jgi:hypothetical protein